MARRRFGPGEFLLVDRWSPPHWRDAGAFDLNGPGRRVLARLRELGAASMRELHREPEDMVFAAQGAAPAAGGLSRQPLESSTLPE